MIAKIFLAVLVISQGMRTGAMAQAVDTKACADSARDSSNQNLSDKLDRTNGVICPPNVDPGIKAPTPEAGKMQIIPPPGSPGGDPSVQPK
jgi:hypothetical protein